MYPRWVVAYMFLALAGILVLHFADSSSDETPGHSGFILVAAFVAAVAATVVALAVTVKRVGPKAVIGSLAMGLLTGLLVSSVADRVIQLVEFSSGKTVQYTQYFLISRAYVSHGKGSSYHIQISDPFDDFALSRDDYGAIFGNSEEVRPSGLCLRAQVQRNGAAMRIMYPEGRTISSGGVVRCPANATVTR
jgi:uncharacterized membrane protein YhaH (DUF805 family)